MRETDRYTEQRRKVEKLKYENTNNAENHSNTSRAFLGGGVWRVH